MFVPDSLKKQNDLIRTLKKQLEAKERELADQKWILEQYLQSPSWRLTSPLRWLARQLRAFRRLLVGEARPAMAATTMPSPESNQETGVVEGEVSSHLKELFTSHYRISLDAFLASGARLHLPQSNLPRISVILVLFNRAELTFACLRSLAENYIEQMEIIVVDNASTDDTSKLLNSVSGAEIIWNPENRHFLEAVNQAAKQARGEYLLLLNNDAQLMPGTLQSALRTIGSRDDIGAVGGRIILFDGSLQEAGSIVWRDGSCLGYGRGDNPFLPVYMFRRDVDYCSGAFLLTQRATWEKLAGFDEVFRPAYYEETDYCIRLWENSLRVVYDPDAVVLHYEFASSDSTRNATDLQRAHQEIFEKRHAPALQKQCHPDPNSILRARTHDKRQRRVLFIDDRVPHPWLGSGFPRAQALLTTLLKQGFFVTFYPLTHFTEEWSSVYSDMPRELEVMTDFGPSLLEAFLRDRRGYYEFIIVSRPHNMQAFQKILSSYPDWFDGTNIIYDAEAVFVSREIGLRRLNGATPTAEEATELLKEEITLAAAADSVIAVSEQDRLTFEKMGINRAYVLGHAISVVSTPKSFDERHGFLFVGAIHEEISPNGDSIIWFLEEIFPRIRATLGDSVYVTIAGINKSERIRKLAGTSVRITGYLEDLSPLYNDARVFVAPTRYAAGIPHKVHEAAARGVPVVATALLAEQLGWKDGVDVVVGGDAEAFAKHCVELHRNKTLWGKLRNRGIESIRRDCSVEVFEMRLKEIMSAGRTRFADVGMDR